jgi:hypothetical protein
MSSFVRDLLVARRALGDAEFVFPALGRGGHIAEPRFPLDAVAEATGIRVSAHDLRRTHITVAESCDISPLALKALVSRISSRPRSTTSQATRPAWRVFTIARPMNAR